MNTNRFFASVVATMMVSGQVAFAEDHAGCMAACDRQLAECTAGIRAVNDLEIEDAKTACQNSDASCRGSCQEKVPDVSGNQEERLAPEQKEEPIQKQTEDPLHEQEPKEKPLQEQSDGDSISNGIKTYQFGN